MSNTALAAAVVVAGGREKINLGTSTTTGRRMLASSAGTALLCFHLYVSYDPDDGAGALWFLDPWSGSWASHSYFTLDCTDEQNWVFATNDHPLTFTMRRISIMIDRAEATTRILAAKAATGMTFAEIAAKVEAHEVWVASALLGQNTMTAEQAVRAGEALDLDSETVVALQTDASRGSLGAAVPTDPLIYRFYEIVQVYGTTLKAVIEEKFGSGIMSAIDFTMDITRREDPKGDRVVVTLDGKFLPYRTW